jgi:hypothetical protein
MLSPNRSAYLEKMPPRSKLPYSEVVKLQDLDDQRAALAEERANVAKLAADLSAKIAKAQRVHDLMQAAE